MTNEQKQLLVKDICARLPYGVKVNVTNSTIYKDPLTVLGIDHSNKIVKIGENIGALYFTHNERVADVKPYLRPMTSMTEEEAVEYFRLQTYNEYADVTGFKIDKATLGLKACVDNVYKWYCWGDISNINCLDWLNERMFDYRGLILEELALPAPDGMYEF